mmetsp:Transcript_78817/g.198039  ORF Transcript_78817/g.198039 Transcript_78817/m.198039 type:complete len:133 (-) Transcript_78817:235-633(-)
MGSPEAMLTGTAVMGERSAERPAQRDGNAAPSVADAAEETVLAEDTLSPVVPSVDAVAATDTLESTAVYSYVHNGVKETFVVASGNTPAFFRLLPEGLPLVATTPLTTGRVLELLGAEMVSPTKAFRGALPG